MRTTIKIPIFKPYNLHFTLHSHGWSHLLPNTFEPSAQSFSRIERLPSSQVVRLEFSADSHALVSEVAIVVTHHRKLSGLDTDAIKKRVASMLRLDEDLAPFYAFCRAVGGKRKKILPGQGHLLRSPDLFEDMVKVICTTNTQWSGTKRMVADLVEQFGAPFPGDPQLKTFPSAADILAVSLEDFKQRVRLGYRANYVYGLALDLSTGRIDTNLLLDEMVPIDEVRSRLLAIKGIGNYAAASLLMLLGRYDSIPVDTVFRDYMRTVYFTDKAYSDAEALKVFDHWDRWKYLAYWIEMMEYYQEG